MSGNLDIATIVNGLYRFNLIWTDGLGVKFTIAITGPDGGVDTHTHVWRASEDSTLDSALEEIQSRLSAVHNVRAHRAGNELSIGTASSDFTAEISVETLDPE